MRYLYLFLVLIPFTLFSQYYSGAEGLYGDNLKLVLHNKIKGHVRYPYSSSSTDVWDILKDADKDPNNSANVILVYTGYSVNAAQEYNNGNGWNREHTWAKSHGFPNESDTAYTDIHHLKPADISTNSDRGNLDFDNGGNPHYDNGNPTGNYYDSDSWEPRDAVKGDVARMMLYMTVRYESSNTYDLELVENIPTSTGTPYFGKKSTLLAWNRIDPPDDFEMNRNEVIYGYQNNRNPFIDHPEFADRIYNESSLLVETTEAISLTEVVVTFSKEVDEATSQNAANYFIDGGIGNPVSASRGYNGDNKKVLLTTATLTAGEIYFIQVSNVNSLTKETIIDNSISAIDVDSGLPVELVAFTGYADNNEVFLNWSTATETNNYGFEIERLIPDHRYSADAGWEKLGFVEGHGNTSSPKDYSFVDSNPAIGNIFYRLKQIDVDGTFDYSPIVEVENNFELKYSLSQNYPNPFNPTTVLEYSVPESSAGNNVVLKVYNSLGMEVAVLVNDKAEAGIHKITFDASDLPSGIYLFSFQAGDKRITKKGILLK
ncbi:MAG: T9SS type A sorting domain-containing protein [Chlorobi bacterium]|nr:T9SS type A sorting domain-containing protein [Chlorobiota bacterium]